MRLFPTQTEPQKGTRTRSLAPVSARSPSRPHDLVFSSSRCRRFVHRHICDHFPCILIEFLFLFRFPSNSSRGQLVGATVHTACIPSQLLTFLLYHRHNLERTVTNSNLPLTTIVNNLLLVPNLLQRSTRACANPF